MGKNPTKRKQNQLLKRSGVGMKWRKSIGLTQDQWNKKVNELTKKR